MKLSALLLASLTLGGCMMSHFGSGTPGSGKLTTSDRKVEGFTRIVNRGPADLEVTSGKSFSVKVTIDDNLEKHLKTSVVNGELVISNEESINPTKCKVVVTMPAISGLRIEGAGDAVISGVDGDSFEGKIDGAGSINVSGRASVSKFEIDGAGDVHAYGLTAESVTATIDGAGSIELQASKDLHAEINGAGDIRYRGNPSVKSKVDGAGSVDKG